jgi:hypothetical protein
MVGIFEFVMNSRPGFKTTYKQPEVAIPAREYSFGGKALLVSSATR